MDLYELMSQRRRDNVPFAVCTIVLVELSAPREAGATMLVFEDGTFAGTVGGGPLEADVLRTASDMLRREERARKVSFQLDHYPEMRCGGAVEVFINPILPQPCLVIVGGGHVGHHLARLAEVVSLPYTLIDDRPEVASAARFPGARRRLIVPIERDPFVDLSITRWDCIALVSRTYEYDERCLEAALRTPARYIGMMGSARKVGGTLAKLESRGLPVRGNPRLRIPIGLDIGDRSPGHIAASILAEVLQVAWKKDGRPHSETGGSSSSPTPSQGAAHAG